MNFETLDKAYYKKQEHESPKWNQETDYWNVHAIIEEAKLIGTLSEKKSDLDRCFQYWHISIIL